MSRRVLRNTISCLSARAPRRAGDLDTIEVFEELGEVLFRGVRMKPGRPAMAAVIAGKPVICLPGFPMSTAVVLWSLVYPLLRQFAGESGDLRQLVRESLGVKDIMETRLLVQHSSSAGIEEWLRMKVARVGDRLYSWALTSRASSGLSRSRTASRCFPPRRLSASGTRGWTSG